MSEKVLLIDDEQEFLDIMADRMRYREMEVTTSPSAEEALKLAEKESYDAIVLDLRMPGMDGLEALKRLKEINPALQVILLTGHATVEQGVQAMKLGAADVMEKPADMRVLTEKIKEAHVRRILLVEQENVEKVHAFFGTKAW